MKSAENIAAKALKLYFGTRLRDANVHSSDTAKKYIHKWLNAVELGNNSLAIKFLASEIRKRADKEIDYNQLWK
jgi:hypothetical protein